MPVTSQDLDAHKALLIARKVFSQAARWKTIKSQMESAGGPGNGGSTGTVTYRIPFHGCLEEIQIFPSIWEHPTAVQEMIVI
jgi:hypothetical protein